MSSVILHYGRNVHDMQKEGPMNISMDIVGNRIRERRKELKLTQTDIHRECGITSGALSQIENGNRVPSAIAFYAISQALQCSMEYLITGITAEPDAKKICANEDTLIKGFHELPVEDQDELLEILQMKLRKNKKDAAVKSSSSTNTGKDNIAG